MPGQMLVPDLQGMEIQGKHSRHQTLLRFFGHLADNSMIEDEDDQASFPMIRTECRLSLDALSGSSISSSTSSLHSFFVVSVHSKIQETRKELRDTRYSLPAMTKEFQCQEHYYKSQL